MTTKDIIAFASSERAKILKGVSFRNSDLEKRRMTLEKRISRIKKALDAKIKPSSIHKKLLVKFKTGDDLEFQIDLDHSDKVEQLKQKIESRTGIHPENQIIEYHDEKGNFNITDASKPISDFGYFEKGNLFVSRKDKFGGEESEGEKEKKSEKLPLERKKISVNNGFSEPWDKKPHIPNFKFNVDGTEYYFDLKYEIYRETDILPEEMDIFVASLIPVDDDDKLDSALENPNSITVKERESGFEKSYILEQLKDVEFVVGKNKEGKRQVRGFHFWDILKAMLNIQAEILDLEGQLSGIKRVAEIVNSESPKNKDQILSALYYLEKEIELEIEIYNTRYNEEENLKENYDYDRFSNLEEYESIKVLLGRVKNLKPEEKDNDVIKEAEAVMWRQYSHYFLTAKKFEFLKKKYDNNPFTNKLLSAIRGIYNKQQIDSATISIIGNLEKDKKYTLISQSILVEDLQYWLKNKGQVTDQYFEGKV